MEHQQMTVPFERLIRDDANVRRKYTKEGIEEMKASILAKGIVQPLAVRPAKVDDNDLGGERFRTFAGGRRMVAMAELVAEQKLAGDYAVPIIIRDVDDAEASELSLTENLIREDMEPADEFRAYKKLIDGGKSVEDVALHFGKTDRYVKGRLALANLHPDILDAFENGKLSFAAACAYTTNPDQEVQIEFFTSGHWNARESWAIKNAMKREAIDADSDMAEFIGEEAYRSAGGVVSEDLFGEDSMWISTNLILGLKAQAIERHRAAALAEGWSFFATTEELGVDGVYRLRALSPEGSDLTDEESDRMQEISDQVEGMMEDDPEYEKLVEEYNQLEAKERAFTPEQKAASGVVIDLDNFQVRYGCLKPGAAQPGEAGDDDDDRPLAKAAKAEKDPLALTQPLKDKIGEIASDALSVSVLNDPHMALALMTAMLANSDDHTMGVGRPSRIKVERVSYDYGSAKASGNIKKSFDMFAKLLPDELLKRFAGFAAQTVDLTEKWFLKDGYTSDDKRASTRTEYLTAFASDPLEFFDAEDWFAACTKPMIEAAAKEMGVPLAGGKKSDMAREAARIAKEKGWLPKELRLKGYALRKDAPAEKPAKAKAKPKKKAA